MVPKNGIQVHQVVAEGDNLSHGTMRNHSSQRDAAMGEISRSRHLWLPLTNKVPLSPGKRIKPLPL